MRDVDRWRAAVAGRRLPDLGGGAGDHEGTAGGGRPCPVQMQLRGERLHVADVEVARVVDEDVQVAGTGRQCRWA